ncbi:MAG: tRNA 2-thiouridine(34) synthase MnmA [Pyramidobacter sp.]|nr:tRNA 2-thiouridine(34) synthase MnmA [Pyramidobacter sp.]
MSKRIVVGISGGVDSTLTALRLKEAGYEVTAVHLVMKDSIDPRDSARMEALERQENISVRHIDCRERFVQKVIQPFLNAYSSGQTPNPCVICNEAVKVRCLIEEADRLGIAQVATGHYAGTMQTEHGHAIVRASSKKDQSYMLYRLPSEWIGRLVFPLRSDEKHDVRQETAQRLHSDQFSLGDSQDICFLGDQNLEDYLRSHLSAESIKPGLITDTEGNALGTHRGVSLYTEGQRKGLGLSGGPWFVRSKDRAENRLVLEHGKETGVHRISFCCANWQQPVSTGTTYSVQYRYRCVPVTGNLIRYDGSSGEFELSLPAGGVAAGQSLVFYDGTMLLGGGIITSAQ